MEDVLEIYKLPYAAKRPVIFMDEMPKQLLADKQDPLPCQAGIPARQDYEYKRNRFGNGPAVTKSRRVSSPVGHHRYALIFKQLRDVLAWIQSVLNQHVASTRAVYL